MPAGTRRSKGRHRKNSAHKTDKCVQWLRVGAVSVGIGAALTAGPGVAFADETASDTNTSAATEQPTASTPDTPDPTKDTGTGTGTGKPSSPTSTVSAQSTTSTATDTATTTTDTVVTDNDDAAPKTETRKAGRTAKADTKADSKHDSKKPEAKTTADTDPPESSYTSQTFAAPEPKPVATTKLPTAAPSQATVAQTALTLSAPAAQDVAPTSAWDGPVTVKGIVADILTWIGLGSLAHNLPIPAVPVPDSIALAWTAIRENQRAYNNQRPTGYITTSEPDLENGYITGQVHATDYEGDDLTYKVTTQPLHGSVIVEPDGSFLYKPNPAYLTTGGPDSFAIAIDDVTDTPHVHGLLGLLGITKPNTATAQVTVPAITDPSNQAPVAGDPKFGITSVDDESGIVIGTVHVTDPDDDSLTYSFATPFDPDLGQVAIDEDTGAWGFKPSPQARLDAWNTLGAESVTFTIVASDGQAETSVVVTAPVVAGFTVYTSPIATLDTTVGPLTVDANGNIYVSSGEELTMYDSDGNYIRSIPFSGSAYGIAIGPDGRIYVSDVNGAAVNGSTVSALDPADDYTSTPVAAIEHPAGLAFDADGRLYVGSVTEQVISVVDIDGTVSAIPVAGLAVGLTVGPDDHLYAVLADPATFEGSLAILALDGTLIDTIDLGADYALDVKTDAAGHVILTRSSGDLTILNYDLTEAATIDLTDNDDPETASALGIALGPDGRLYATDREGDLTVVEIAKVEDYIWEYTYGDDGLIEGTITLFDPFDDITYIVDPLDPEIGTVTIDADTGAWTFTPTLQARYDSWLGELDGHEIPITFYASGAEDPYDTLVINTWVEPGFEVSSESFSIPGLSPTAIAVRPDGGLIVVGFDPNSDTTGVVGFVDPDGTIGDSIALPGVVGDVVIGADNLIYVTDFINGTVSTIDPANGNAVTVIHSVESANGLALDSAGRLYVTGFDPLGGTSSISVFNSDGSLATVIPFTGFAFDVAIDAEDRLYVSSTTENNITIFDTLGNKLGEFGWADSVYGITISPNGNVFAANLVDQTIEYHFIGFDDAGLYYEYTGSFPVDTQPAGVAVDDDGRIYVAGVYDGSITIVTPQPLSV